MNLISPVKKVENNSTESLMFQVQCFYCLLVFGTHRFFGKTMEKFHDVENTIFNLIKVKYRYKIINQWNIPPE